MGLDADEGPCVANQCDEEGRQLPPQRRLDREQATELVVTRTMERLYERAKVAEKRIREEFDPEKAALVKKLENTQTELRQATSVMTRVHALTGSALQSPPADPKST
jgi:hypothetical protein